VAIPSGIFSNTFQPLISQPLISQPLISQPLVSATTEPGNDVEVTKGRWQQSAPQRGSDKSEEDGGQYRQPSKRQ